MTSGRGPRVPKTVKNPSHQLLLNCDLVFHLSCHCDDAECVLIVVTDGSVEGSYGFDRSRVSTIQEV